MRSKPILCLDFDGVIHSYTSRWQATDVIPDPPTEGFFDWAVEADKHFRLVVYSSRSRTPEGRAAMKRWLTKEFRSWREKGGFGPFPMFEFAVEKPPAFMTIDDRAVRFEGDWSALDPEALLEMRPWNVR
jgi:hypothetical protein